MIRIIITEKIEKEIIVEETKIIEVYCDFCKKKFNPKKNKWGEVEIRFWGKENIKLEYLGEICKNCFNNLFKSKLRKVEEDDIRPVFVKIKKGI